MHLLHLLNCERLPVCPLTMGKTSGSVSAIRLNKARLGLLQVWQLDLLTLQWHQVACKGSVPPFRVHCSSAVVENRWILHGGRIPAPSTKFNVQNQTYVLDLNTWR